MKKPSTTWCNCITVHKSTQPHVPVGVRRTMRRALMTPREAIYAVNAGVLS